MISEPETETYQIQQDDDLLILSTDGLFMAPDYCEEKVAQMVHELRLDPNNSLTDITKKITDECCTDFYSKDNLTLIIVDLKKYYSEHQHKLISSPISNQ